MIPADIKKKKEESEGEKKETRAVDLHGFFFSFLWESFAEYTTVQQIEKLETESIRKERPFGFIFFYSDSYNASVSRIPSLHAPGAKDDWR